MRGAPVELVTSAIEERDSFPGTYGFAGELPDGTVVRDVLGRQPLFFDADSGVTAYTPHELATAASFPAGHVWDRRSDPQRVFELPDPDIVTETATGDGTDTVDETATIDGADTVDERTAIDKVRQAIQEAHAGVDTNGLAVAFSGGVDSALVASFLDVPLYVVGYEGSADVEAARASAAAMGRSGDLTVHEVTLDDIEAVVPDVAHAIGRTNAMDVQIAAPLYLVAQRVAADGYDRVALGQGADELFGGYAKIANAPDDHRVEADTIRGARREVLETLPAQLERDVLAVRTAGVEPLTPLLHDSVVEAALGLPESLLVDTDGARGEEIRKVALRRVAAERLPAEVAFREKKAVQYGSLVAREIDRLARQAGFKRRMDDHVQQYIEARLDEQG